MQNISARRVACAVARAGANRVGARSLGEGFPAEARRHFFSSRPRAGERAFVIAVEHAGAQEERHLAAGRGRAFQGRADAILRLFEIARGASTA